MPAAEVLLVAAFAASMVGTPGPANMLLFASGFNFGYRRSLPFLIGQNGGFQFVSLAGAAGLGSILAARPDVYGVLKILSMAYIVYLAIRVALSRPGDGDAAENWGFMRGIIVHPLNPKAYATVIAAYVTFAGDGPDYASRALVIFAVFLFVSFPLNSLWVLGGGFIRHGVSDGRILRAINVFLAVLMVAIVVYAGWVM